MNWLKSQTVKIFRMRLLTVRQAMLSDIKLSMISNTERSSLSSLILHQHPTVLLLQRVLQQSGVPLPTGPSITLNSIDEYIAPVKQEKPRPSML
jgi:hypothetical protein